MQRRTNNGIMVKSRSLTSRIASEEKMEEGKKEKGWGPPHIRSGCFKNRQRHFTTL